MLIFHDHITRRQVLVERHSIVAIEDMEEYSNIHLASGKSFELAESAEQVMDALSNADMAARQSKGMPI